MKKTSLLFLTILLSAFAFGQKESDASKETKIDIYYFHRAERCATCLSIEENTLATLDEYFADELKDGTISIVSINYEGDEEMEIIEMFEAEDPALYLVKVKKGKETTKNLTDFAFENSLHNPKKFKKGLRDNLNKMLR
jgi:hypothetical protein